MFVRRAPATVGVHQLVAVQLGYVLTVFCTTAYAALVWWHRQVSAPEYAPLYTSLFVALLAGSASLACALFAFRGSVLPLQLTLWLVLLGQLPLLVMGAFGLVGNSDLPVFGALVGLGLLLGLFRTALDRLLTVACHVAEAAYLDCQSRAAMWLAIGLGTLFGVTLAHLDPASSSLWILMLSSAVTLSALFVPDLVENRTRPIFEAPLRNRVYDELVGWLAIGACWGFAVAALGTVVMFGENEQGERSPALLAIGSLGIAFGSMARVVATRGREELSAALFGLLLLAFGTGALTVSTGSVFRTAEWFVVGWGLGALISSPSALSRQFSIHSPLAVRVLQSRLHVGAAALLGTLAGFNFGGAIAPTTCALALLGIGLLLWLNPATVLELLLRVRTNGARTLRVLDVANSPDSGPVLYITGHLDTEDLLVVRQGLPRHTRFLVPATAATEEMRYALDLLDPIVAPFDPADPTGLAVALNELRETWRHGGAVCVMNEAHFEVSDRNRARFGSLFWRIVRRYNVQIVPVAINRGWGKICEVKGLHAPLMTQLRVGQPIDLSFGQPLPATTPSWRVREAVQLLSSEQMIRRRALERTLPWYLLRACRRYSNQLCMADTTGQELTYRQVLQRLIVLARLLRRHLSPDEDMVALVLPPSVGGALFNLALALIGKTSVNLNFTSSEEALRSAVAQCKIRTIFTSEKLLRRLGLKLPVEPTLVESLRDQVRFSDRLIAGVGSYLLPLRLLEWFVFRAPRMRADDTLTVIFSSGSTGDPKGVMLTHHNVLTNCQGAIQALQPTSKDRLIATLPLFHSFGYLTGCWVPFFVGAAAIYHTSPLEPRQIGELTEKYGGSILVTTPTFLRSYIRRIPPKQFATLRLVITGAEKLPSTVAQACRERFGVEPLEGYGCTELSPVACVNTPTFYGADGVPLGPRFGTVGHPIAGVTAQVRDLDSEEPVGPGHDGMLYIKGPNVMKGYLNRPRLTKQVVVDGWYMTGDVARIDADGFVTITDRLARFSKIGGEMVPHVRVEEALHQLVGSDEVHLAVVGIPDPQKGERLVVLHETLPIDLDTLYERLKSSGLPNLWIPDRKMFFEVPEIPVLASGKLDLRKARQLALELVTAAQAERAVR